MLIERKMYKRQRTLMFDGTLVLTTILYSSKYHNLQKLRIETEKTIKILKRILQKFIKIT